MEQSPKTLTFVVPAYNMETYLERCVESLLSATDNSDIEVLIVDDGSSDGTPELADMYERRWPGNVRAIHQVNKGHGGAVNTGIANATGMYVKVVDADDWVDTPSIDTLMGTLRVQRVATDPVDMIVTNYVYDKVGKRVKHTVNFRHAMATNTVLGWDDLGTRSTSISSTHTSRSRGSNRCCTWTSRSTTTSSGARGRAYRPT